MICSQEQLITFGTLDLAFSKRNTRKNICFGLQMITGTWLFFTTSGLCQRSSTHLESGLFLRDVSEMSHKTFVQLKQHRLILPVIEFSVSGITLYLFLFCFFHSMILVKFTQLLYWYFVPLHCLLYSTNEYTTYVWYWICLLLMDILVVSSLFFNHCR